MLTARATMLLAVVAIACAPVGAVGSERQPPAKVAASTGEITVDVYELI